MPKACFQHAPVLASQDSPGIFSDRRNMRAARPVAAGAWEMFRARNMGGLWSNTFPGGSARGAGSVSRAKHL